MLNAFLQIFRIGTVELKVHCIENSKTRGPTVLVKRRRLILSHLIWICDDDVTNITCDISTSYFSVKKNYCPLLKSYVIGKSLKFKGILSSTNMKTVDFVGSF